MTAAAIMLVMGVGDLLLGARSLAAAGAGDVATATPPRGTGPAAVRRSALDWIVVAAAWLVAAVALVLVTSLPWLGAAVAVAVALLASVLLESRGRVLPLLGCAVVVIAIAVAVVFDTTAVVEGSLLDELVAGSALAGGSLSASVLVIAASALVFIGATSNTLVRAVVGAARGADRVADADAAPPAPDTESWQLLRRGRELGVLRKRESAPVVWGFRGGRIVGPLERVLVFAALLAGVPVVIAGLVAAKGVVRFPEISADRGGGVKAEEFLVGTLCSFLLAALAALAVLVRSV